VQTGNGQLAGSNGSYDLPQGPAVEDDEVHRLKHPYSACRAPGSFAANPSSAAQLRPDLHLIAQSEGKGAELLNDLTANNPALDYLGGKVLARTVLQHARRQWLEFLKRIDRKTSPELDLHLALDNHATHKHGTLEKWLAK
jgi:hypothetical protein